VLVNHLDPDHEKAFWLTLQDKHTAMPVLLAEDKLRVQPNHVYVIPPNSYQEICNGSLRVSRPTEHLSMCRGSPRAQTIWHHGAPLPLARIRGSNG
jgi:chemotaxis response regulator CheB